MRSAQRTPALAVFIPVLLNPTNLLVSERKSRIFKRPRLSNIFPSRNSSLYSQDLELQALHPRPPRVPTEFFLPTSIPAFLARPFLVLAMICGGPISPTEPDSSYPVWHPSLTIESSLRTYFQFGTRRGSLQGRGPSLHLPPGTKFSPFLGQKAGKRQQLRKA